jgi:beta-lactamase regulating signal transducer with metallopeptidase domain
MTSSLHAIAELLALRFLDSLIEGTLICLLGALMVRFIPRQNAATRFALWFSALVAIAALPWIGGMLPRAEFNVAATGHAAITLPDSWALYVLALWGGVVCWFAFGVVRALWHLNVLRRNCVPVDVAELDPILRDTLQRHGANRRIALCTSEQVRVPTAVGLFKPMVLVPSWVMRDLSPTELNQILLHELAHFRRWDDWTNLAQQIVKAIFFFHPAVWWIDKKVAVEREIACDDAVLAETRSPRAYAECLAHLAEKSFVNRSIALAQAAIGKIRQTSDRIAQILDVGRPASTSGSWGVAVSTIAVLVVACGAFYSRSPRLVAFEDSGHVAQRVATSSPADAQESSSDLLIPVTQAKLDLHLAPVKLKTRTGARRTPRPEPAQVRQAKASKTQDENLIHRTRFTSATVPFAETFWVVVESAGMNPAAPQVYQIQMWRVTVLRTVFSAPSRQVSRSET